METFGFVSAFVVDHWTKFRTVVKCAAEMHSHGQLSNRASRYSAKSHSKPINFYCSAPEAQSVFLVGDFNDWHPTAQPMARQPDGTWFAQVPLNHGHHHYRFLVDGAPQLDPRAQGTARNELNEKVSLIAVS